LILQRLWPLPFFSFGFSIHLVTLTDRLRQWLKKSLNHCCARRIQGVAGDVSGFAQIASFVDAMIVGVISCWLSLSGVRGQRGVAAQSTDDLKKPGKIWQASVWLLNKGDKWLLYA
jgi:hypothetical protein